MSSFLPKENVSLRSVQRFQPNTLAKDLSGLANSILGVAKTYSDSKIQENETIAKILARDKLVELKKKTEEEKRILAEKGNQYDFETGTNTVSFEVAKSLKEVEDKFGKDSKAYQAFLNSYLISATKMSEGFKTSLTITQETFAKQETREKALNDLEVIGNDTTTSTFDSIAESYKVAGGNIETFSGKVINKFIGDFTQKNINPKDFYENGKLNKDKLRAEFEENFGAIAYLDKDLNIHPKTNNVLSKDIAKLKIALRTYIGTQAQKEEYNFEFKKRKGEAEAILGKFVPTGNLEEDMNKLEELNSSLQDSLFSVSQPKNGDISSYENLKTKIDTKKNELVINYEVARDNSSIANALENGYIDTTVGRVKANRDYLKSIVQSQYNNILNTYANTQDEREKDILVTALVDKIKTTGVQSSLLQTTLKKVDSLQLMPNELLESMTLINKMESKGYQKPANIIFDEDIQPKIISILKDEKMNDIDKMNKVKKLVIGEQHTKEVLKSKNANITFGVINNVLKDPNYREELLNNFPMFTNDDNTNFNGSIVGGAYTMAIEYSKFAFDNNFFIGNPEDKEAIIGSLKNLMTGNSKFDGLTGRKFLPSVIKVDERTKTIISKKIDMDIIYSEVKRRLGTKSDINEDNVAIKYNYNSASKSMEAEIYIKHNNGFMSKAPLFTITTDNYEKVISDYAKEEALKNNKNNAFNIMYSN